MTRPICWRNPGPFGGWLWIVEYGHGWPSFSYLMVLRMSLMVAVAEPQTAEELYALYKRVLARRYNPPVKSQKVILALVRQTRQDWSTARAGTNTRKAGPEPKQPSTRSAT
jgi:hypothetical protein